MSCIVCSDTANQKFVATEMAFGFKEKFEYFQCSSCGCLQIKKVPDNLEKYYPTNYYSFDKASASLKYILWSKQLRQGLSGNPALTKMLYRIAPALFRDIYSKGMLNVKLKKDSRILDVGCGTGKFPYILALAGFRNPVGIDPYVSAGLSYSNGAIIKKEKIADTEGKFDLILFNHSFEHISNQLETLVKVRSLLSDRGLCVLVMPTVSSYAWTHYRENWVQLDAPRHLILHSERSLKKLAKAANLRVMDMIYDSNAFQFWGSIQYQKGIGLFEQKSYLTNPRKSIFSSQEIRAFNKYAKMLDAKRQGDTAAFLLAKN
ncbi:MAG: class I SAM-dependent methyltransferase [Candidatus Bathyarchaeota archaeon]|nr:class I SAM-dependent methyltransferase [Candidatus Bathyarchaeota archaeon]